MKKIDWYYVGAFVATFAMYIMYSPEQGTLTALGWILAKKAFPRE